MRASAAALSALLAAVPAVCALALADPNAAPAQHAYHIITARSPAVRFVRLYEDIAINGSPGTETTNWDLRSPAYSERVSAGLLSQADGYDGTRFWSADSTGMPLVEGNATNRASALVTAWFYGRVDGLHVRIRKLKPRAGAERDELQFSAVPGPVDVTFTKDARHIAEIDDRSLPEEPVTTIFSDYRVAGGVELPFRVDTTTVLSRQIERVRRVETFTSLAADTFAVPSPPNDTTLNGATTVPMVLDRALRPVIDVRIPGGPVLHMLFDTGGSNSLTPWAAARLHVRQTGNGESEEPGVAPHAVFFAAIPRFSIGRATIRNQTFSIDAAATGRGLDGTVGCEVLQRFAVRLNFHARTMTLARDPTLIAPAVTPLAMRLNDCQPEVDGGFDSFRGPMDIDTGSDGLLDVYAPFVKAHELIARYRARQIDASEGADALVEYLAFATAVRLGSADFQLHGIRLPIALQMLGRGSFASSTGLGNVGAMFFLLFDDVTFDIRSGRIWIDSSHKNMLGHGAR